MNDSNTIYVADEGLALQLWEEEDAVWAQLEDQTTACRWGPSLLAALEVHDRTVRREQRLEKYGVHLLEQEGTRAHAVIGNTFRGIHIGIWAYIEQGELVVRLALPEVYERKPAHFRLFAMDLLPGLLETDARGELLLPVGRGARCRPGNKPALSDRFLMYMEQPRWELATLLPIAGAATPEGGMIVLATSGDCDAECRVATDGEGNGRVGFGAMFRQHWPDPVDRETRELRFTPVSPEADLVHAAARRVHRYMRETLGKSTLKERIQADSGLAHTARGLTMKMPFAQENEGFEMMRYSKDDPVTYFQGMTFDEAGECLHQLRDAGVEQIHTLMVGWNARGHDGMYPTRFPIDERLGGESGLRELIEKGHKLGYQMNVHDNFMMNVPHAPDYDPTCVTHDVYGEPLLHGWWSGGLEYQSWPLAFGRERVEGHLERMHDLGIRGTYYCDYMMQPLEKNYHPQYRGPRRDHIRGQQRIWKAARGAFGSVGTEFGALPAALCCDYIMSADGWPGNPQWDITHIIDEKVPLWELTMHGLVLKSVRGVSWSKVLQEVAYGAQPQVHCAKRPFRKNIVELNETNIARIKAVYDIAVARFGYLREETLERCDESAEGITATQFSDGTEVYADRNEGRLWVNGEEIKRPEALADEG